AVGKSTFLRLLGATFPRWHLVTEPVTQWRQVPGGGGAAEVTPAGTDGIAAPCGRGQPHPTALPPQAPAGCANLLQLMYQDPARWSYTFQTFSCISRMKMMLEPPPERLPGTPDPVRVFERSVYSDR
ncbi:DGUOK protein, partial [Semnornis frantzii]|nr:DGUOK protein [Semnornis frantzii]